MYRTILVPVDPSAGGEAALPVAATLARQAGAGIELLGVVPSGADDTGAREHLAERAHPLPVAAETRVVASDDVAGAIRAQADDADTLVCMETRARRPITEAVLGSVADEVVRELHRPVLLVGPHCGPAPERFATMVVGLDGSDLAEAILPVVRDWSTGLGITPWVFQVLTERMPLEVGGEDVHESAYVHRVASRLQHEGVPAEFEVSREHQAAPAIADFAADQPASLVAVTTHGRSGISRVALGSAAGEVVRRATVPVLVVRPEQG
ncbi:MAG: universal stress protein [Acidimicrobiia bacterium]